MLTLGKVRNEKDPGDAGSGELGRSWRGETAPAGEPGDRERSVHHDKAMIVATRARKLSTSSTIALPFSSRLMIGASPDGVLNEPFTLSHRWLPKAPSQARRPPRWKLFRQTTPGAAILQTQIAPAAREHGRGSDDFPLSITSSRVGDGNILPLSRVDRRAPLHGNAGAEGREVILGGVLLDHGILVDVPRRTHLGDVQAGDLVLGGHAVAPDHIDDLEENERSREDPDEIRQHADRLGQELLEPTAIEKAKRSLVGDAIPASTILAIGEEANGQAAEGAAGTVDADGTDGVVDLEHPLDDEYT